MLLSLAQWLQTLSPDELGFFRVFQYLTFRAVMAAMTALLIGLAFGPWVIRRLTALKIGQPIREYGVQAHLAKRGTPTMGGVLILIGIGVSHAAVVRLEQPLRLDRDAGDLRLRRHRLGRRLAQGRAARTPRACARARSSSGRSLIGLVAALYLAFSVSETSQPARARAVPALGAERLLATTCRRRPT